ncbi:POK9 protein, partial [Eulacestoma nigropectus]|nr:POK9 protein [Eulacestoma nigropectus]
SGTAGVDVSTVQEVTLLDSQVQCVPTNAKGPLGKGLSALLLGQLSTSQQGVFVLPGVIDADYQVIIHITVWTPNPPVQIPEGEKIGQLVPFQSLVPKATNRLRGTGGFGSTGSPQIYLAMDIKNSKPQCKVLLTWKDESTCKLTMLVDTEADVTII